MTNFKVYTSYFYQVRNMNPSCLAFSTAHGDPGWFHAFTGDKEIRFIDKNGVLNGLRAEPFVPRLELDDVDMCSGPEHCPHKSLDICPFLSEYEKLLYRLDPKEMEQRFLKVGEAWQEFLREKLDITYILLVHEAPTNPCSERVMLQKWLKEIGMGGEEWKKQLV